MSVARARSQLAVEVKQAKRKPNPESQQRVEAARRKLAAENLEAYIRRVVDTCPPLTPEQRDHLALLLRGAV